MFRLNFKIRKFSSFIQRIEGELKGIKEAGTWKTERVIISPQDSEITVASGKKVLNFCQFFFSFSFSFSFSYFLILSFKIGANNYLGLSSHPNVVAAAKRTIDERGFGLSSVRFICGTQDIHTQLEQAIANFHGKEAAILYPSCFDANAGIFEQITGPEDAIISDTLNHGNTIFFNII